jgi:hypothetical protein
MMGSGDIGIDVFNRGIHHYRWVGHRPRRDGTKVPGSMVISGMTLLRGSRWMLWDTDGLEIGSTVADGMVSV